MDIQWIYNGTHFLTQKEDDIFHLLKFLLLGSNFQFYSYRSCPLLLSLFPVCFFPRFVDIVFLKNCIFNLLFLHIYFCMYFRITALNSICDTFPWILMSYEGKYALAE